MPISITRKTIVATYHHARQSDLDPTEPELQGFHQILQSNYENILPTEMTAQGLDPTDPALVDLSLLLAELTESTSVRARARRGCAVVAGLQRAGTRFSDSAALALPMAAPRAARAAPRAATARRAPGRRRRRTPSRRRSTGGGNS